MNSAPTLPPDRDLRPATRARQRDELIALLEAESGPVRRRRLLVPVAAAASIALIVGAALALPRLRHDSSPAPAGIPEHLVRTQEFEPLPSAEVASLGRKCLANFRLDKSKDAKVIQSLRATQPPKDAFVTTWVLTYGAGLWQTCGYNQAGVLVDGAGANEDSELRRVVAPYGIGSGLYTKSISRVTITPIGGQPVEAVLRNGFYYASVSKVRVRGPRTDKTPRPYVVRGYDATGKLVYTSPRTDGEVRQAQSGCYLDPTGKKLVGWMSDNPHPDPKTCPRTIAWHWLPN